MFIGFTFCAFGQSNYSMDSIRFSAINTNIFDNPSISLTSTPNSLVFVDRNHTFQDWKYETELLQSLDNYTLKVNSFLNPSNGVIQIDFENIGKQSFDNYFGEFNNDLSKYIQRAPDIMWLCPIY